MSNAVQNALAKEIEKLARQEGLVEEAKELVNIFPKEAKYINSLARRERAVEVTKKNIGIMERYIKKNS
jgi:hypothetical protein